MPEFYYKASSDKGEVTDGYIQASEKNEALKILESRDWCVLELKEKYSFGGILKFFEGSITIKDQILFTKQLILYIRSGIPIPEAIETMSKQVDNLLFRKVLDNIRLQIQGGETLGSALVRHTDVFGKIYGESVLAGEESGALKEVLERLVNSLEVKRDIISKIRSALIYPLILLVAAGCIFTYIMVSVLPEFEKIFSQMRIQLPEATWYLLRFSEIFRSYGVLLIPFLFFVIVFLKKIKSSEELSEKVDAVLLNIPFVSKFLILKAITDFSMILKLMLENGIPVVNSLGVVCRTIQNRFIGKKIEKSLPSIKEGFSLTESFQKYSVFPPLVIQLIHTGEKGSNLEDMLGNIYDYHRGELDESLKNFSVIIEPILMLGIGSVLGIVIMALFLPVLQMSQVGL